MTSSLPFDDFRSLVRKLPMPDLAAADRVRESLSEQGLGRLEEFASWFVAATGRVPPRVANPVVALFAGTHLASPLIKNEHIRDVLAKVEAIAAGAAPISHLCSSNNLGLNVFDLALEIPVDDITRAAALEERAAAATMAFGMEVLATGGDLLCLGTVDDSADASAMALLSVLGGDANMHWPEASDAEREIVAGALGFHDGEMEDPLEAMRRLGGREIAAMAGAILASRTQKVAVLLDGLPATAAAAVIHALEPSALSHCLLAGSVSGTHERAAARIGLSPILDFGILGNGVGASLAAGVVRSACEIAAGIAEVHARQSQP